MTWLLPLDFGLTSGLIYLCPVLALAISFRLFNFPDITVEGSVPLGAAIFASAQIAGFSLSLCILLSISGGMLAGAFTAAIHLKLKLNKFLSGILVVAVLYSLSIRIMGGANIGLIREQTIFDSVTFLNDLSWPSKLGSNILLLFSAVGLIAILSLWLRSNSGLKVRSGCLNPEHSERIGISPTLSLIIGLSVCNGLAALGGTIVAMSNSFADIGLGQGVLILCLASMTIGEKLVPKSNLKIHFFVLLSALVGSIVYQVIISYCLRFGVSPVDLKLVTALSVIIVLALGLLNNKSSLIEEFNE